MSAAETPVDVDVLRDEIRKTYTDVSTAPEQEFIFPTGRAWAQELGYPEPELRAGLRLRARPDSVDAGRR
jgi:arsenite methyltransferase